ncbi:hypothetical protein TNCV_807501 [Trichonephila clavipes]|nr:hypothetical protein TNCV_807501 [Trichonephila clavipes]
MVSINAIVQFLSHGCDSRVVKVSDRGWPCHELEPCTTKDPPCRQRCSLNQSRAQTSSRCCGVVVTRWGASAETMTRRKGLNPDEIAHFLQELSENESDGGKLSCSNVDPN